MTKHTSINYQILTPFFQQEDCFKAIFPAFKVKGIKDYNLNYFKLQDPSFKLELYLLSSFRCEQYDKDEDYYASNEDDAKDDVYDEDSHLQIDSLNTRLKDIFNYFYSLKKVDKSLLHNVLQHLNMCISIVNVNIIYDKDISYDKKEMLKSQIFASTLALKGLLLTEDKSLFTGDNKLLLDKDGNSSYKSYKAPKLDIDKDLGALNPSSAKLRKKTIDYCYAQDICLGSCIPLFEKGRTRRQKHDAVCKRALAILALALLGDCHINKEMSYKKSMDIVQEHVLSKFDAKAYMTKEELTFFKDKKDEDEDGLLYAFEYETLYVLFFALSLFDDEIMPPPRDKVDPKIFLDKLKDFKDIDDFIAKTKLIDNKTLIQNADVYFALFNYSCSFSNKKCSADEITHIVEDIVEKRYETLLWLCGIDKFSIMYI